MKVIFAGTPSFAVFALRELLGSAHEILAVFTQPDRPQGRGLKLTPPPVKILSEVHRLPLYQPTSLKEEATQTIIKNYAPDALVVAAYGMLLPEAILTIPPFGCINIHPSLLPRWRGAAPIQRTLFAGDALTGVTIMQMEKGLDTGPILKTEEYVIKPTDTALSLHDTLGQMGATLLISTLNDLEQHNIRPKPQDHSLATYATKLTKEEAAIYWQEDAVIIERKIRAYWSWPVAYTRLNDEIIRIAEAQVITNEETSHLPGTILSANKQGILVQTGKGLLNIKTLQWPGGKMLDIALLYQSKQTLLKPGVVFS